MKSRWWARLRQAAGLGLGAGPAGLHDGKTRLIIDGIASQDFSERDFSERVSVSSFHLVACRRAEGLPAGG